MRGSAPGAPAAVGTPIGGNIAHTLLAPPLPIHNREESRRSPARGCIVLTPEPTQISSEMSFCVSRLVKALLK
jgi:hypothetical protein